MNQVKRIFKVRELSILFIILIYIAILGSSKPDAFFNPINLFGLGHLISINLIVAGAVTVLFIAGGIDISIGATLGLCGMIIGKLVGSMKMSVPLGIIFTILAGAAIGFVLGFIVSYLNINAFITTLGAWFIIESFKFIIGGGKNIIGFPSSFGLISSYKIFNVPFVLIFALLSMIIFDILLRKNVFFRQYPYIGGNETGAILAGIRVKRNKLLNYVLVSSMAAIAGIFLTSRFMTAYSVAGQENTFQIITAVIIGGASLKGGRGSVIGTFLGLILMGLIYNSLVLWGIDLYWHKVVVGAILLIVVLIDVNINKVSET